MNRTKFQEDIVRPRLLNIESTLKSKGAEYADNVDGSDSVFYNFERAAEMLNTTREEALLGMMSKHLTFVIDLAQGKYREAHQELDWQEGFSIISEKIGDTINYLILLEGMLKEPFQGMLKEPFFRDYVVGGAGGKDEKGA